MVKDFALWAMRQASFLVPPGGFRERLLKDDTVARLHGRHGRIQPPRKDAGSYGGRGEFFQARSD